MKAISSSPFISSTLPPSASPPPQASSETPSTILTSPSLSPGLSVEQQKGLASTLLKALGWDKKYSLYSLRQALLKELSEQCAKTADSPDDHLEMIFQACIRLLKPTQAPTPNLDSLPEGKKISLLMKQASLMDLSVQEILGGSSPARDQTLQITLVNELLSRLKTAFKAQGKELLKRHQTIKQTQAKSSLESQSSLTGLFGKNLQKKCKQANVLKEKPPEDLKILPGLANVERTQLMTRLQVFTGALESSLEEFFLETKHLLADSPPINFLLASQHCVRTYGYFLVRIGTLQESIDAMKKQIVQSLPAQGKIGASHDDESFKQFRKFYEKLGSEEGPLEGMFQFAKQFQNFDRCDEMLKILRGLKESYLPLLNLLAEQLELNAKAALKNPQAAKSEEWAGTADAIASHKRDQRRASLPPKTKPPKKLPQETKRATSAPVVPPTIAHAIPILENYAELSFHLDTYRKALSHHLKRLKGIIEHLPPPVQEEIQNSLSEFRHHMVHGSVSLEALMQAIQRNHWEAITEIVPLLILDWGIQLEQIITISHLAKFHHFPLSHSLTERLESVLAKESPVSNVLKNHLGMMEMGPLWGRYPIDGIHYYARRNEPLPLGLKVIQLSIDQPHKQAVQIVDGLMQLQFQQLESLGQLTEIVTNEKFAPVCQEKAVDFCKQLRLALLEKIASSPEAKPRQGKMFAEPISRLEECLDSSPKLSRLRYNNPLIPLKEALRHLKGLSQTLALLEGNTLSRHAAWFFRNGMRLQLIFEQLYRARAIAMGCENVKTHDLQEYHQMLNDPDEMAVTYFDFGQGFHYSVHEDQPQGNMAPLQLLKDLEKGIKPFIGVDEGFMKQGKGKTFTSFRGPLNQLIADALPLMSKHVDKTIQALRAKETYLF